MLSIVGASSSRGAHSPGALAGICRLLANEHVNIIALSLESSGRLHLIVDNAVRASGALATQHHQVTAADVLFVITGNQPGGITPVLVTQPALFGETIDPTTHIDLREVQVNGRGNGLLEWRLLELYNDVTREVGAASGVAVIDLAKLMPKDSRYYYDYLHFTNEGAVRVGDIVYAGIASALEH